MTLCIGFIAIAVWRARAQLGRTVSAEGERNNLARRYSPNLVDRLAGVLRGFGGADSRHFPPVGAVQVLGRGELIEVFVMPLSNAAARGATSQAAARAGNAALRDARRTGC